MTDHINLFVQLKKSLVRKLLEVENRFKSGFLENRLKSVTVMWCVELVCHCLLKMTFQKFIFEIFDLVETWSKFCNSLQTLENEAFFKHLSFTFCSSILERSAIFAYKIRVQNLKIFLHFSRKLKICNKFTAFLSQQG